MTDTTTPPLTVPPAAVAALHEAGDEPTVEYVRAVSAPVVAAELRRLSDLYRQEAKGTAALALGVDGHYDGAAEAVEGEAHGYSNVADALLARADELDPPT